MGSRAARTLMPAGGPDSITYVGHSTVLLEIDGARILTDPMLRSRAGFLRRHPPAVAPDSFASLDLVLISHLHRDHLDLPSLRALAPGIPLLVPRGAGELLAGAGHERVIEIGAGETTSVGPIEVTAVPAEHDNRRGPWGPTAEPLGFVVAERSARRVYFAGDTDLFDGMAEIGPLEVALLPVWGWGHKLGPGHLDPERAARALSLLRPRLAVPIHWGTYHPAGLRRTLGHLLTDPPHQFARIAAERSPEVRVEVLQPGARLALERMARP